MVWAMDSWNSAPAFIIGFSPKLYSG
jgi:hypothetical protein